MSSVRARDRHHRLEPPRPGPRDDVRPGGGRPSGGRARRDHRGPRRHPPGPEGLGTLGSRSTALGGGALVRGSRGARQGPADRREHAGGWCRGRRRRPWRLSCRRRATHGFRGSNVADRRIAGGGPAGGRRAGARGHALFRGPGEVWSSGAVVGPCPGPDTGRLSSSCSCGWTTPGRSSTPCWPTATSMAGSRRPGADVMEPIIFDPDGHLPHRHADGLRDPARRRHAGRLHRAGPHGLAIEPAGRQGARRGGLHRAAAGLVNAAVDALSPFGVDTWTCRSPRSACAPRSRSDASESPAAPPSGYQRLNQTAAAKAATEAATSTQSGIAQRERPPEEMVMRTIDIHAHLVPQSLGGPSRPA